MRPLNLRMEGFTAFRDRTEIDFSKLDLFAITGPTGAGKSSIIDAICFALYGRVPRVNNEVKSCISQGRERMQVTFEFTADQRQYRVIRETKLKPGAAATVIYVHRDGDWAPVASGARDVNQAVERIVGLDFEGFTRSVLLPQGQFQEFLAGSPDRRRDVLQRLLRLEIYERVRQRAANEASSKRAQAEGIERQLREDLANATPETLRARERDLEEAERRVERLAAEIGSLEKGQALLVDLNAARKALTDATDQREGADRELEAASRTVDEAGSQLEDLRKEHEDIKAALAANTYDDQLLAALTGALNLVLQLQETEKRRLEKENGLKHGAKEVDRLKAAAEAATARKEAAAAARERAKAEYEEAQRHDLAAAIQAGLKPGDDCPVCGAKVGKLPPRKASAIEEARHALSQAENEEKAAAKAVQDAASAQAAAVERLAGLERELQGLDEQVKDLSARLKASAPKGLPASFEALQKALDEQKAQRSRRVHLAADEQRLSASIGKTEAEFAAANARLDTLKARLETTQRAVEAAQVAVAEAERRALAAAEAAGWSEMLATLRAGGNPLPALEAALAAARAEHTRAATEEGRLRAEVRQIESDIARADQLRKEVTTVKAQYDVASDLAQMLRADRFQAYLQAEALRALAEAGSRRLLDLSEGRYELSVAEGGQDFEVVDRWNADERRSVRTLSGGETFLASLALALALADSMPGLAPDRRVTLESIFLDEGFGTLDPEALMLARQALEGLSLGERFVCVVTHLAEFAEALPARITVRKSPSGSTVQIV